MDRVNENLIQMTLDQISTDTITVTVAHRLNTIKNSDRIYVIEKGKVARLLEAYPDRTPLLFGGGGEDRPPVLVPYEAGMATLWGVPEGQ